MAVKKIVKKVSKKSQSIPLDELLDQDIPSNFRKMGMSEKEVKKMIRDNPKLMTVAECLRDVATEKHGKALLKCTVPVVTQSQSPAEDVWEIRILCAGSVKGYETIQEMLQLEELKRRLKHGIEDIIKGRSKDVADSKPKREITGHA